MPLLAEFKIKNPSGDEINGYHVAYLHERAKTGGSAGTPSAATVNIKAATLDIVFVIDTSASMQPMIDATKDVVGELAKRLADDPAKTAPVRFGLVAYRDRINARDPSWYITKTFWELNRTAETSPDAVGKGTDISEFLNVLGSVTAGEISSEDTPEDVLGGLREAVRLPGWNPNGYKHIVLIGDASGHVDGDDVKNPEKLTIDGLKAMMQPSGKDNVGSKIICHAIRILGEDMSDWPKCEAQFAKLAEGVDFNGLYATFKKGEKADFTDKLVDLINKSRESLKPFITGEATAAVPAASPAPGGSSPAPAAAGTAAPVIPPDAPPGFGLLLEMAAASKGEGDVPTFASGYVGSTDTDGKEQVEPFLLVQFGQFRTFQSILNLSVNAVRSAGDPGSRDVEKIVSTLQIACTQLSINETIKPDTPLHVIFNFLLGFPVKNDIFAVTPQKLASMTQEDFDQWTKKMEACDSIVKGYIENPKLWRPLGRNTNPEFRQGFLRISELP